MTGAREKVKKMTAAKKATAKATAAAKGSNYDGPTAKPCSVKGCARRSEARGLCGKCYEWARRHGATPIRITPLGRVAS